MFLTTTIEIRYGFGSTQLATKTWRLFGVPVAKTEFVL